MSDNPYQVSGSQLVLQDDDDAIMIPASHGKRFAAYFIDSMVVAFPMLCLFVVGIIAIDPDEATIDAFSLLFQFGLIGAYVLYGAALEGGPSHATIGKRLMGLQVLHANGAGLSFGQALGRNALKWFLMSLCSLVPLLILTGNDNRAPWDTGRTQVVERLRG